MECRPMAKSKTLVTSFGKSKEIFKILKINLPLQNNTVRKHKEDLCLLGHVV
jgi:hypothetical protein